MKRRALIRMSMELVRDRLGLSKKVEILGITCNPATAEFEFLLGGDGLPECPELNEPRCIPIDGMI